MQTGDSTVTDAQGFFSLDSEDTKSSVDFAIDASDVHTVVNVATIDPSSTSISLNVKVDKVKNSAQVQIVDVRAQIVGTCDPAFENNEVIRQANKIAKGTICTVRVKVFGDGHPLVGEKISLQRHSCASDAAPWTTITEGNILADGFGMMDFHFYDDVNRCQYRVVAPYLNDTIPPTLLLIDTFTAQTLGK